MNKQHVPEGTVENIIAFLKTFSTQGLLQSILSWVVIVIVIMTITWTPVSSITDRRFWLKELQVKNTYELQVKTMEFLENDVMDRLDDIYKRLDSVEEMDSLQNKRIDSLDQRVTELEASQ